MVVGGTCDGVHVVVKKRDPRLLSHVTPFRKKCEKYRQREMGGSFGTEDPESVTPAPGSMGRDVSHRHGPLLLL